VNRQRAEDVALLRHPADAGAGAPFGGQLGDIAAVEANGAAPVAGDTDIELISVVLPMPLRPSSASDWP